jgi:hypothetical protein
MGVHMRFLRCVVASSVLLGASLMLGCGDEKGKPMKNMQPGTGPEKEVEQKLKGGKTKPEPPVPPSPKPPPLP